MQLRLANPEQAREMLEDARFRRDNALKLSFDETQPSPFERWRELVAIAEEFLRDKGINT